jgi:prevent-host-death family protein
MESRISDPTTEATRITATELARNLSDVLNRVRYKGERFVVVRNGEELARLEPRPEHRRMTFAEFVDVVRTAPKPDDEFWEDVEEARQLMNQPIPERSPWDC